ncbi:MAG: serpin family protein [Bacteroidales bacterium]
MKTIVNMIILAAFLLSCEDKHVPDLPPQGPADLNLSAKTTDIIESDNEFGLELFKKVVAGEPDAENIFVSPTSVALALAMTYNGAAGETKSAMETALRKAGFTTEEINNAYKSLIEALKSVDPKVLLEIANSIWYAEGFNVLPQFISVNEEYYNAEVSSLDFTLPQARAVINDWVSDQTNEKIKTIIDQIPANAVMYLINAIYFKGIWQYEFDKNNTFNGPFYSTDGSPVTVPYMKNKLSLPMMSTEQFSMLELPYGRGNYSMVILLPEEGYSTQDVVNSLTPENWDSWVSSFAYANNIDIQVPKFKFEYENLLNDELDNMGMGVAFTGSADFSGINGTGNLFISRVIHKSFVEVNEEGTEAAAATAVEIEYTSIGFGPVFHVDRPFVFAIRETTTGAVLFIGRVQNPL